ncbi:tail fiber protein [Vibrio phage PJN101]|nr:tail fiber protein [Vibrio phage PJN101]
MGMNIWDSRESGSTVITDEQGVTRLAAEDDSLVVSCEEDQLIVENPTCTEVVSLGDGQYLRGEKGETGEEPEHEWIDTSLRFRRPDGSWGWLVDLQGEKGEKGDQGIQGPAGIGVEGPQGNDGITRYAWVKYADTVTPTPEEMYQSPEGRIYFGIAYNKLLDEGEGDPLEFDYTQYKWSKILGEDGIPGTPGGQGPTGPAGVGFTWIGEFPEHPTEADIGRPLEDGDTYFNTTDNKVYTYAGGWHTMLESGGEGPIGPQGAPGGGFEYQGEFTSSPSGALVNWLYRNINNDLFYMYDGTSWILATSDGKDSPDGAPCGNGLRFFTTYHDSTTTPARPTLDGDTGGWNPNAHTFTPGTIKWVSQKIATEPELGAWNDPIDITTHEYRGPVGFRGSQSILIPIPGWNGNWDDNIAASACTGGAPQEWDIVTMYKSEDPAVQETRRWAYNPQNSIWEWLVYNYVFLGDVLVDGTLDAQKINVNSTLTVGTGNNVAKVSGEDNIRIAVGHADKTLAPFRVYQDGSVVIDNPPDNINNDDLEVIETYRQNSAPTGTIVTGSIWYDTNDQNKPYRYNGNAWQEVRDDGVITDAKANGTIYPDQDNLSISGNYVSGSSGWAIDRYGNSEFNNSTFRGDVYASSLTLTGSGAQLSSNDYTSGLDGWTINSDGTAEFNDVTVRGTGYFTDGVFGGTVYAEHISGDIVSGIVKANPTASEIRPGGVAGTWIDLSTVVNVSHTRPYPRRLQLTATDGYDIIQFMAEVERNVGFILTFELVSSTGVTVWSTSKSYSSIGSGDDNLITVGFPSINGYIPANTPAGSYKFRVKSNHDIFHAWYMYRSLGTARIAIDSQLVAYLFKDSSELS